MEEDDYIDDDQPQVRSRRRAAAAAAAATAFGNNRPPAVDGSTWLNIAELSLRALLKFLGALADLVDRVLGSVEPQQQQQQRVQQPMQQQQQRRRRYEPDEPDDEQFLRRTRREEVDRSWWWMRFFRWMGGAARTQLLGVTTLLPDSNSFWVISVLILVVAFLFVGYRSSFRLYRIVEEVEVPRAHSKRLLLPNGRTIAYKAHGVSEAKAKHSGLVLQGIVSRKPNLPGFFANETLLHEFGIRLVSYDLPGSGSSDPDPDMTFYTSCQDMLAIADALGLGERFWLLVYAGGGPYAWAAIKYIPQRLAGIVMVAPLDSPFKQEISSLEGVKVPHEQSIEWKITLFFARHLPSLARMFIDTKAIANRLSKINKRTYAAAAETEQVLFKQKEFITFWEENLRQSEANMNRPASEEAPQLEELLRLLNSGWSGFGRLVSFPSFRISFKRLPSLFFGGARSGPDRQETFEGAAFEGAVGFEARSGTLWQVFKHKLSLIVLLILILLVVLR